MQRIKNMLLVLLMLTVVVSQHVTGPALLKAEAAEGLHPVAAAQPKTEIKSEPGSRQMVSIAEKLTEKQKSEEPPAVLPEPKPEKYEAAVPAAHVSETQAAADPPYTDYHISQFTVYHYCPCYRCNRNDHRITKTGTMLTEGRTIAVDPDYIPLGSTVIIDGHAFVAEDTGVFGRKIDVFVDAPHDEVYRMGKRTAEVYLRVSDGENVR